MNQMRIIQTNQTFMSRSSVWYSSNMTKCQKQTSSRQSFLTLMFRNIGVNGSFDSFRNQISLLFSQTNSLKTPFRMKRQSSIRFDCQTELFWTSQVICILYSKLLHCKMQVQGSYQTWDSLLQRKISWIGKLF